MLSCLQPYKPSVNTRPPFVLLSLSAINYLFLLPKIAVLQYYISGFKIVFFKGGVVIDN